MSMISASILNADLAHLSNVAETIQSSGADALHYDVMDGCFVDNLSFGLPVMRSLRACTELPFDVHLMIQNPLRFVARFAEAGAQMLSFHLESDSDAIKTIQSIHDSGIRAGVALSPDTPLDGLYPVLQALQPDDFVLLMTVQPGWGSQSFLPYVLPKIRSLRDHLLQTEQKIHIQVDGGIQADTAAMCRAAGADYLVSGSFLLAADDPASAVRVLRGEMH